MKLGFILLALLALFAFPTLAQDGATHTVTFNDFSFTFNTSVATNVNITLVSGDPPDVDQMGGPETPHTQFALYSQSPDLEVDAPIVIRVYPVADFAVNEIRTQRLEQLQTLLAERPDLVSFTAADVTAENTLPHVPIVGAAQMLRARAQYVDTGSVSGITYIAAYGQSQFPFTGDGFLYTFQGISANGASYISANFRVNTSLFPAEPPTDLDMEEFLAGYEQYLTDSVSTLNAASPEDFSPSLTALDTMIQSFAFTTSEPPVTEVPPIEVTPTEVIDPSLGGLADTWNLVSYGSADAPTPVLENAPVTLAFTPEGATGNASCNQYSGSFQYANNIITFGELITTRVACADDIMAQETAYLNALATVTTYAVSGGQLQIFYEEGVLTFNSATRAPATPEASDEALGDLARTWTLVSYGDLNNPQPVIGDIPVTLTIAPDGVNGNAGCNQFGTPTIVIEGNSVTIGQIVSTLMACADEAVMAQEIAYLSALQSVTSFEIADGQLHLFYDGEVLNFTAA